MNKPKWAAPFLLLGRGDPKVLGLIRIVFVFGFWFSLRFTMDRFLVFSGNCETVWAPISYFHLLPQLCINPTLARGFIFFWHLSLFLSAIGFFTRTSLMTSFLLSLYLVPYFLNFGKVHHVTHLPMVLLGILSLSRCGDAFSIDALLMKRDLSLKTEVDYYWPIQMCRFYIGWVYFFAALQKLKNGGLQWFDPTNMQVILLSRIMRTPLGEAIGSSVVLSGGAAASIFLIEVLAPIGFFFPSQSTYIGIGLALFHLFSFFTMGHDGFFFSHIWCMVFLLNLGMLQKFLKR